MCISDAFYDMFYYWCCYFVIFFFKQKTAYEMRISDWSSDVCSSDLWHQRRDAAGGFAVELAGVGVHGVAFAGGGPDIKTQLACPVPGEIGRASCRERVCQYV